MYVVDSRKVMGGNGKHQKWLIPLRISSSPSRKTPNKSETPREFLCPISGVLMFDPVVVSSGQTFERTSVDVCTDLGFNPTLPDGSISNFSIVIPNLALKTTISNWCQKSQSDPPRLPDYSSIESSVRALMAECSEKDSRIRVSERELLKGVAENPPVICSRAASELNPRNNHHLYSSSSSEESVIANSTPSLLPFTTRPACYSSPSSGSSTSSEIIYDDTLMGPLSASSSSGEEESFVSKMKSLDVYEQEQSVVNLRKTTRKDEESRISLCSMRLLQALKPLFMSRYSGVQINASASLVNLSLANVNKVKIVRSGIVPILIDLLKNGFEESKEHAAGAIFSLALEDDNKVAIGVLGALQPLLHALRSGSERTRHDSALALYHLTLVKSNRVKLIKLGAIGMLLGMLRNGDLASRVLLIVCNLAVCEEGRSALLDANAVECLVAMLREGTFEFNISESTREKCVAALYSLSHGNMRFKGLAKAVGAVDVLVAVVERGGERAKKKAKMILVMLRGKDEEWKEVDWEGVMKGGVSQHRVGMKTIGPNSSKF